MQRTQVFLGWDKPLLNQAAEYLLQQHRSDELLDLSTIALLLPGRKACRLMLRQLSQLAEEEHIFLLPPRLLTLSALPPLLCIPEHPLSDDIQQLLSWTQALATSADASTQKILVGQARPASLKRWIPLAKKIQETWNELGSCGLRFQEIADYLKNNLQNLEAERWSAIAEVFEKYREILNEQDLSDPNDEYMKALENSALSCDLHIYAIGMPDIPLLHRKMLEASSVSSTVLVYAPEQLASAFDDFGCVQTESWFKHELSVPAETLCFTHSTAEQADLMRHLLEDNIEQKEIPAVSIISLDKSLLPSITRTLAQKNVALRSPLGTPLLETAPCVFLTRLAKLAREGSFSALAAIVRNPCLAAWHKGASKTDEDAQSSRIVSLFDEVHDAHLPTEVKNLGALRAVFAGNDEALAQLADFADSLQQLIPAFLEDGASGDIEHWCQATADLLNKLYPPTQTASRTQTAAVKELFMVLSALRAFAESDFSCSADDFLALLLEGCATHTIAEEPHERGIDLEGWLDLLFSDCSHTCILGFNEENIPQSVTPSPFLNEQLRRHIGALDARKRFARDSYLLHAALSAKNSLSILASRYNAAGESLLLSRLVLQEKREILLERLQSFFSTSSLSLPPEDEARKKIRYQVPQIQKRRETALPLKLSPTQLRDYLECPFRYYLKYILRLERIDSSAQELDQRLFGSLAHSVLQSFSSHSSRDSTDETEIARALSGLLDKASALQFGSPSRASVKIQVEQLRVRLSAFAHWQAEHRAAGWEILRAEHQFSSDSLLIPASGSTDPIELRGVIDRIDYNRNTDAYLVLDYKTGDSAKDAGAAHRKRDGTWVNLQLPLYLLHSRQMLESENVTAGYINLAADADAKKDSMRSSADWNEDELQEARSEASRIAQRIEQQVFWPPSERPPKYDSFAELFPLEEEWFANE